MSTNAPAKVRVVSVALMLFSMFFGAGNLIFPPMVAAGAGTNFVPAITGFLLGAVGLPIIAMIAVAIRGTDILDLSARSGKVFSIIFSAACYLSIGAFYALPRTGAVSFLAAAQPIFGWSSPLASVLFNAVFFGVGMWLALNPKTLVSKLGNIMTPALLILLVLLVSLSITKLGGVELPPTAQYADNPLATGLLQGYTTMDSIAALAFGILVISSLKYRGIKTQRELLTKTSAAGIIAGVLLAIIYLGLGLVGHHIPDPHSYQDGTALLSDAAHMTMGFGGQIVLGIIVLLACMTTAVGLLAATSEFFHRLTPGISYRAWLIIFGITSFLIASAGLETVLSFAGPIIGFLYPVAITIVVCTLIDAAVKKVRIFWGFRLATWLAALWSGLVTLSGSGIGSGIIGPLTSWAPLHSVDMGWVVPTFSLLGVGIIIDAMTQHRIKTS